MKSISKKNIIIAVSICNILFVSGCAGPPSVYNYQPPPSTPVMSSLERDVLDEGAIERLIASGDAEYARANYSAAKDFYYEAMLVQRDPDSYVLASYAATLAHLELFSNAIEIFRMALRKDPDNEMIMRNISICQEIIQEEAIEQQMFEVQRRLDQIQDLLNLAGTVRDLNREVRKTVRTYQSSGTNVSGSIGAVQYSEESQDVNTGGGDPRDGKSKNRDYNCVGRGGATDKYRNAESAAQSAYKDLENDCSGSTAGYKKNSLRKYQSNMKSIRQEASRNSCSISQSSWETKWPSCAK